jgi:hypothetical protein
MEVTQHKLAPDKLLLDPNNYRFHDLPGYKEVANRNRYSEDGVQKRALELLSDTEAFELESLKDSILTNGFVPLEQIVVEEFKPEGASTRYVVIEGNRRAAAVKILLAEHEAGGIAIDEENLESLMSLTVVEIKGAVAERRNYKQTLMAIRHVAGIREWGPYQQAKLIVELFEDAGENFTQVAQRIGISAKEVGRRYRASKALQQMENDEEFGDSAVPKLYSFFHEAVSQPKVREWLDFSDDTFSARNEENRKAFYELMSPREIDGERRPPKLQNANREVRQLKEIVDKPVPLSILLDPERPFEDAVRAAADETVSDETGMLEHSLSVAVHALRTPGIDSWSEPNERARVLWASVVKIIEQINKLMSEK